MAGLNPSFIHILLCDNDFGRELEFAAGAVANTMVGELFVNEQRVKEVIVDLMVAHHNLIEAATGFSCSTEHVRVYLLGNLAVRFEAGKPAIDLDHDGGSACIDRHTRFFWRF